MKKAPTLPARPAHAVPEKLLDILTTLLALDPDEITRGASLANDLGADDLDVIELGMELEETFDIQLTEAEEERLESATVGDLIDILKRRKIEVR